MGTAEDWDQEADLFRVRTTLRSDPRSDRARGARDAVVGVPGGGGRGITRGAVSGLRSENRARGTVAEQGAVLEAFRGSGRTGLRIGIGAASGAALRSG